MSTTLRYKNSEDFRRFVGEVRERHNISDVVSRWTKLKRLKTEWVGLCLQHSERTPSMRVNDAKGQVYCFGCGYTGDIFRVVQDRLGLSFMEALRLIAGDELPLIDPAERIRQRAEDQAARLRDATDAVAMWNSCHPADGTPTEVYLRHARGLTLPIPDSIRFGVVPAWRDKVGAWGPSFPAMVCGVFDRSGAVVGIQRVFLRDGGRAKAAWRRPKKSLGVIKGASLRLGPVRSCIIVCEGPEDGLSLAQELPDCSVWPTLGTALMPHVEYPEEVREIVLAGQNDGAGRNATDAAALALVDRGFQVRTMFPDPAFKDWNDQLRGVSS